VFPNSKLQELFRGCDRFERGQVPASREPVGSPNVGCSGGGTKAGKGAREGCDGKSGKLPPDLGTGGAGGLKEGGKAERGHLGGRQKNDKTGGAAEGKKSRQQREGGYTLS